MLFNQEVKNIIKDAGLNVEDTLTFLVALYYKLSPPTYLNNQEFMAKVQLLRIVEPGPKWNIPLFQGQETNFDWVRSEYCTLFEDAGKNKYVREATERMKDLFAKNPAIRKDEIIGATEIYLSQTDVRYVQFPHYFITKGKGVDKTQAILTWVDTYKIANEQFERGVHNRLQ